MTNEPYASRLASLRAEICAQNLDGFLVPMSDAYQSEYVPASDQRIAFLSGFTGSAGLIVVLAHEAAFFTDSRYTLQAKHQIPQDLFDCFDVADKMPTVWTKEKSAIDARIGYDPWLHTEGAIERWNQALAPRNITLVPVTTNPIDKLWLDQPAEPSAPVIPYDLRFAGQSSADKRAALGAELKKNKCDVALVADPASVAWLLNVRGNDVPHTPLPLSRLFLHADASVDWFIAPEKRSVDLLALRTPDIRLHAPIELASFIDNLGATPKRLHLDKNETAAWIFERLSKTQISLDQGEDICALPKACKNEVELHGMRQAHRRDGVAMVRFLAWLDAQQPTSITELDVVKKIDGFRSENDLYRDLSFATIAASGSHAAIVHYQPTEETSRALEEGSFLLLDSGAQYLDGTTDITRTIPLGNITDDMREKFTRVLKGHIALASARFPTGTSGADLDVLARQHLWQVSLDYGHGTGHGVGCYLGVHEGPHAISRRSQTPLRPGMITSNEPGYYETGSFGIRIESLLAVVEQPTRAPAGKDFLGFETISLAPIDRRAINVTLLTQSEIDWLNDYHAKVRETLLPLIKDAPTRTWLAAATSSL